MVLLCQTPVYYLSLLSFFDLLIKDLSVIVVNVVDVVVVVLLVLADLIIFISGQKF